MSFIFLLLKALKSRTQSTTVLLIAALGGFQCGQDASPANVYLFLGHPYDWNQPDRIDYRLERLEFAQYDQIWLGGDVCSHLTEKPETLEYLDSLFDLGSERMHWSLGNHDIMHGNVEWITEKTGRPAFYTTWVDGICLMVLNTNLFWFFPDDPPAIDCAEKERQLEMIFRVADTVSAASHLVILHHHALFNELKINASGNRIEVFNINPVPVRATCDPESDFTAIVYSRLEKAQRRGVQVVLVGGDFGMQAKEFEFRTQEGIWMLGSGINNSLDPRYAPEYVTTFDLDKVLVFKHFPKKRKLEWKFVKLEN
jgi:hypothetical protein